MPPHLFTKTYRLFYINNINKLVHKYIYTHAIRTLYELVNDDENFYNYHEKISKTLSKNNNTCSEYGISDFIIDKMIVVKRQKMINGKWVNITSKYKHVGYYPYDSMWISSHLSYKNQVYLDKNFGGNDHHHVRASQMCHGVNLSFSDQDQLNEHCILIQLVSYDEYEYEREINILIDINEFHHLFTFEK
jgi:hypothetical protein